MTLFDSLHEECIKIISEDIGKPEVLNEITHLAKKNEILKNVSEEEIYSGLSKREEVGTTGFGNGIAIPHCALESISGFVTGILIHSKGTEFNSLDGKAVKIFAFIIGPKSQRNEHIHLLSGISRVLNNNSAVNELLSEKAPEAIKESFLRYAIDDVDPSQSDEKSLFHLFIQKEEQFDKLLEIFSEIKDSSVSVIEAKNASHYFNQVPLFAGFLDNKKRDYHWIIIATVRKKLANEALRQITTITGDLKKAEGVLVLVQDIFFSSGFLNY